MEQIACVTCTLLLFTSRAEALDLLEIRQAAGKFGYGSSAWIGEEM